MEMRIASTARADLDDMEDVGIGHRTNERANGLGWRLHDHLPLCYCACTQWWQASLTQPLLCERGATQCPGAGHWVHWMYRAGWGQSVRTEHHLAHPRGSARWCFGLELCLT